MLGCIGRITADSASGRDAVFRTHTLQDAIIRNLQVLCESVRRIDAVYGLGRSPAGVVPACCGTHIVNGLKE